MNPEVAKIVGALSGGDTFPTGGMSYINEDFPTGGMSIAPVPFPEPKNVKPTISEGLQAPTDVTATAPQSVNPTPYIKTTRAGVNLTSTEQEGGVSGGTSDSNLLTKDQINNYMKGTSYMLKSISSFTNGFTANISYEMQRNNKQWQAKQNERSARLLLANQREINRAAQMDANVYRIQGASTKSNQKVAMAQTGFAVGKGIYRNTLDTTDARVNYNTSAIILKAELQNAELVRRAGLYEAEAIINKADASIARKQGKAAMWQGVTDGIAYGLTSSAYFYYGKHPVGD